MNKYEGKKGPKSKTATIHISDIKNKFDVRVNLDQDTVLQFVGMYQDATKVVPPIKVVVHGEGYAFVDGRHRAAARQYLNLDSIDAEILEGSFADSAVDLFAMALQANCGGAKTPTRGDLEHTVMRMLEFGASKSDIMNKLDFLPKGSVKAFIASAAGKIQKRKLTKAIDALATDNLSVDEAAKRFGVRIENLKDAIQGKKGKWGKNRTNEVEITTASKAAIAQTLNYANKSIGMGLNKLIELVEEGSISVKAALNVIGMWEDRNRQTEKRINDWRSRFIAIEEAHKTSDRNLRNDDQEELRVN